MELKWSEKYAIGNEIIDIQHKMLFTIVNDLNHQILNNTAIEHIEETLEKMSAYAVMHFRTEEDLLFKSEYGDYQEHRKHHDDFKKKIMKTAQDIIENKNMNTVIDIHRYLTDWLNNHILSEDVKYREHID